jgi:FkbM family methyltransferase
MVLYNVRESGRIENDLIYDVGMHTGADTAFFLHQGFRVIAIEANPQMVDAARCRFHSELASGRLTILNLGIVETAGTETFWICDDDSGASSFSQKLISRTGQPCHPIEIQTRPFGEILDTYSVPYYLKVDIEGNDDLCIRALAGGPLPLYISMECKSFGADDEEYEEEVPKVDELTDLPLLYELGYRRFKLISQYGFAPELYSDVATFARRLVQSAATGRLRAPGVSLLAKHITNQAWLFRKHRYEFTPQSSGPWGEGTPGKWLSLEQAKAVYEKASQRYLRSVRQGKMEKFCFWCDWHASI